MWKNDPLRKPAIPAAAFVAINVAVVASLVHWMVAAIPAFEGEPSTLVFVPVVVLTAILSWPLHAFVRRDGRAMARVLSSYGAFVVLLFAYGLYLDQFLSSPTHGLGPLNAILLSLWFGHWFGLPVLLALLAAQAAASVAWRRCVSRSS